jgi:hypothetical protein
MAIHRASANKSLLAKVLITLLFVIFLYPFSFDIGGHGVSGNYLFILFPISIWFLSNKIHLPNQNIRIIMSLYVLIFVVAYVYQYSYYQFAVRRTASFIIFMITFIYMSIKIDKDLIGCFKLSIVLISITFSFYTIQTYFSLGGADLGFGGKGAVGSQRFGFVYIMAIWIIYYYMPTKKIFIPFKYVAISVILGGLLLTFSRSGIVAIIGSVLIFFSVNILSNLSVKNLFSQRFLISLVLSVFTGTIIYLVLKSAFPVAFDFFNARLFSIKTTTGTSVYDIANPASSEGFRIYMVKIISELVLLNPFTGSGYLGSWILFKDLGGSAHNQYLDVFFRTGIFGFGAYLYLLYRLLKFLKFSDPSLFWGLIGVLIYGLFHETFKLSQGGFILSFMLGMMTQKRGYKGYHARHLPDNSLSP